MGRRISEALNHSPISSQKLIAYLGGEREANSFLATITSPRWLMSLLQIALGSPQNAIHFLDAYEHSTPGSVEQKATVNLATEVTGNENFVKVFLQKYTPLVERVVNNLKEVLKGETDNVSDVFKSCLMEMPPLLKKMELITGASPEVIWSLIESTKRCDEVEALGILEDLVSCIIKKHVSTNCVHLHSYLIYNLLANWRQQNSKKKI